LKYFARCKSQVGRAGIRGRSSEATYRRTVNDPENTFHGKQMKNGWKNSGLPWTYDLNLEQMRLPI
jgi:hypothetical protein